MKIILTASELTAIHTICETVENGSVAEIIKCIERNPLTERREANDNSGDIMFAIDPDYMTDALKETTKVAGVVYPCLKAAYKAFEGYIRTVADLAEVHAKRAMSGIRRRQARIANHMSNTADAVSIDHIVKILTSNGAKKVSDLVPPQQEMLRKTYRASVISAAEATLQHMEDDGLTVIDTSGSMSNHIGDIGKHFKA